MQIVIVGTLVTFVGTDNVTELEAKAAKGLVPHQHYTVSKVEAGTKATLIYLKEVPGRAYNLEMFDILGTLEPGAEEEVVEATALLPPEPVVDRAARLITTHDVDGQVKDSVVVALTKVLGFAVVKGPTQLLAGVDRTVRGEIEPIIDLLQFYDSEGSRKNSRHATSEEVALWNVSVASEYRKILERLEELNNVLLKE